MYEKTILLFILVNIPIICFYNQLVKFININDIPDKARKLQKKEVPLFGGILIIYNLIVFFLIDYFFILNPYKYFFNTREHFVFFAGILSCFLIGLYDDKYDLSAIKKLVLNFFLILFLILIDETLLISELHFSFNSNSIELRNFSYPFTILCILLLINALNMFDGVNLQVGVYCILILILLSIKELYTFINLIIILSLILFLIYNYLNKAYLGDAGTQILAFLISYILIKSHNTSNNITPDQIFVILSFPGLDMFRLFLFRIINGVSPFKADRNHIHHLLINRFSLSKTNIILILLAILPIFLFSFIGINFFVVLTIFTSIYFLLILKLS